jgi:hypothetical protein
MAEKRPADSGPEEAITNMEEGSKRPRHEELTEAELQAQVRPHALPASPACLHHVPCATPSLLTTLYRHREDSMLSIKRWECYHRLLGD